MKDALAEKIMFGVVQDLNMKSRLINTVLATLSMILCAAASGYLAPLLWHGISGSGFYPPAMTMAILIFLLAVVFRRAFRWIILDFILGLLIVEVITLAVIADVTGLTGLETFDYANLLWLAFMNLFIGLPWLLGYGLGSLWLRYLGHHHAQDTQPSASGDANSGRS